jgi:hypothetical protein
MVTFTVEPGDATPRIIGFAAFTIAPFAGAVIAMGGAVLLTVKVLDAVPMFPAASEVRATTVWAPSPSGIAMGSDHIPLASAATIVAVPPSIVTVTVAPGSALPEIDSAPLATVLPSTGDAIVIGGAIVSTTNIVDAVALFPAASTARATTE